MGCPINSIEQLENGLRYRKQKMVVVILASANSDSRATDFVLRNFHEMDILSDDRFAINLLSIHIEINEA